MHGCKWNRILFHWKSRLYDSRKIHNLSDSWVPCLISLENPISHESREIRREIPSSGDEISCNTVFINQDVYLLCNVVFVTAVVAIVVVCCSCHCWYCCCRRRGRCLLLLLSLLSFAIHVIADIVVVVVVVIIVVVCCSCHCWYCRRRRCCRFCRLLSYLSCRLAHAIYRQSGNFTKIWNLKARTSKKTLFFHLNFTKVNWKYYKRKYLKFPLGAQDI